MRNALPNFSIYFNRWKFKQECGKKWEKFPPSEKEKTRVNARAVHQFHLSTSSYAYAHWIKRSRVGLSPILYCFINTSILIEVKGCCVPPRRLFQNKSSFILLQARCCWLGNSTINYSAVTVEHTWSGFLQQYPINSLTKLIVYWTIIPWTNLWCFSYTYIP